MISRDFHGHGVVKNDVSRVVGTDVLREDIDQCLHALSDGALLDTSR